MSTSTAKARTVHAFFFSLWYLFPFVHSIFIILFIISFLSPFSLCQIFSANNIGWFPSPPLSGVRERVVVQSSYKKWSSELRTLTFTYVLVMGRALPCSSGVQPGFQK
jgi:hypothetical protein